MLPAAVLFLPLSYLPPQTAAFVEEGIAIAAFAYALTRDCYWRLPLLLSYQLIFLGLRRRSLMIAAMFLPGFVPPINFTIDVWATPMTSRGRTSSVRSSFRC
jgi:hypothetical protein